jgi:branched-subunit amino acid transport protein
MSIFSALVLGGLLTFLMRFSFIYLLGRVTLPAPLSRALRFAPAAVFSAIVTPELFLHSGSLDLSLGNSVLLAGVLSVLVAWRTKNTMLTIVVGIGFLAALEALT